VSSYDRFPGKSSAFRASARSSIPMSSASCRCARPVVAYASQTDLLAQLTRAGIAVYVYRHGSLADITAACVNWAAASA